MHSQYSSGPVDIYVTPRGDGMSIPMVLANAIRTNDERRYINVTTGNTTRSILVHVAVETLPPIRPPAEDSSSTDDFSSTDLASGVSALVSRGVVATFDMSYKAVERKREQALCAVLMPLVWAFNRPNRRLRAGACSERTSKPRQECHIRPRSRKPRPLTGCALTTWNGWKQ